MATYGYWHYIGQCRFRGLNVEIFKTFMQFIGMSLGNLILGNIRNVTVMKHVMVYLLFQDATFADWFRANEFIILCLHPFLACQWSYKNRTDWPTPELN